MVKLAILAVLLLIPVTASADRYQDMNDRRQEQAQRDAQRRTDENYREYRREWQREYDRNRYK